MLVMVWIPNPRLLEQMLASSNRVAFLHSIVDVGIHGMIHSHADSYQWVDYWIVVVVADKDAVVVAAAVVDKIAVEVVVVMADKTVVVVLVAVVAAVAGIVGLDNFVVVVVDIDLGLVVGDKVVDSPVVVPL